MPKGMAVTRMTPMYLNPPISSGMAGLAALVEALDDGGRRHVTQCLAVSARPLPDLLLGERSEQDLAVHLVVSSLLLLKQKSNRRAQNGQHIPAPP